jgi:hypothetical protein
MATTDSISDNARRALLEANDKLTEAKALASFVQSISLNGTATDGLLLQPAQLTGFYYVLENMIDRIKEAEDFINAARKQPEVVAPPA